MRESHLLPEKVRSLERLTLNRSPFGATFGVSYQKMTIGSHMKTFKTTAQIIPTVSPTTLKASTVVNRTAMHEVLVGVNHSGEEFFADVGVPLQSSCLPDSCSLWLMGKPVPRGCIVLR